MLVCVFEAGPAVARVWVNEAGRPASCVFRTEGPFENPVAEISAGLHGVDEKELTLWR
jgi:hypothetical protein